MSDRWGGEVEMVEYILKVYAYLRTLLYTRVRKEFKITTPPLHLLHPHKNTKKFFAKTISLLT